MQSEYSKHENTVAEGLLFESLGPKPCLDQSFNETVLHRYGGGTGKRRFGWGGWLMTIWWSVTIALVGYSMGILATFDSEVGLPLMIVLGTLTLSGGLLFVVLRRCGFRLSDALLNSLELN